jgi:hypothetical protein
MNAEGDNHFITVLDKLPASITMIEEYAVSERMVRDMRYGCHNQGFVGKTTGKGRPGMGRWE